MKEVIAYVHTHWDREWYQNFEEFRLRLIEVIDRVVCELEKGNLPSFYFDGQVGAFEDYLEIHPENLEKIKKLIQEKKLFVGPFYCLSDVFLVNSKMLERNLEFGIKKSKELGCYDFIAYLADTFGHSKGILPILKKFGLDKIVMWRGLPTLPSEFLWEDFKALNLQRGYFQNVFSLKNLSPEQKAQMLENELEKIAQFSENEIFLPIGGDHLACPENLAVQIEEVNKFLKNFKIKLGNLFEYFEKVENNFKQKYSGEFLDNSKTFLLKGVYSSRIYLKQKNARCQWLLGNIAEPLQKIAHELGYTKSFQNECDYAFKLLIKNHAHDGIYGCSADDVHREMMTRFEKVEAVAKGVIARVQNSFGNDDGVSFINLSPYNFSGIVRVKTEKNFSDVPSIATTRGFTRQKLLDIDDVPVVEDVVDLYEYLFEIQNLPAFSAMPLEKIKSQKKSNLIITKNELSNDKVELKIKGNKISIKDKISGKIYDNFLIFKDEQDTGDSYNFAPLKNDKISQSVLTKTEILRKTPIECALKLFFEIKIGEKKTPHIIEVVAILQNLSDFVEFKLNWENKEKNHRLQANFCLQKPIEEVVSEDTTGTITRTFDPFYNLRDHLPAPKGVELKTNSAPFQRFAAAQGVCVLTEGLHEYEVEKNNFKITILRSTGIISNPKNPVRGTPAGPPIDTPELQCLGRCEARFAVCFSENVSDYFKNADAFYSPVVPVFGKIEGCFIDNLATNCNAF